MRLRWRWRHVRWFGAVQCTRHDVAPAPGFAVDCSGGLYRGMTRGDSMVEITDSMRAAIQQAYDSVLNMETGSDSIAFEAAVMVYRRLVPAVTEPEARDRVSSVIAEGLSEAALSWTRKAR